LLATSRDTVETTRPIRPAITVKVSPRSRPARISSRSPIDNRAADGFKSVADGGLADQHVGHRVPGALDHPSDLAKTMALGGEPPDLALQL
jgi:hypothetical protein